MDFNNVYFVLFCLLIGLGVVWCGLVCSWLCGGGLLTYFGCCLLILRWFCGLVVTWWLVLIVGVSC